MSDDRYLAAKKRRDDAARDMAVVLEERWYLYRKERPADHVHEKGCQSLKSWGGGVCTCSINMTLRREAVLAAGAANDRVILDELGCMEQSTWHEGRRSVDPTHQNPYRSK